MPRIEFEQAEVISAAGRAWYWYEPAIIQENGFPVASIVFTGESKNSFAGYGVVLDFQITDSEGNNYAAQIGKELVATAAESQFPGDFTKAKVVEDPHNLIATDDGYGRGFEPFNIAAYRIVAKCEGSPEETIGKLEMAISSAKKMKKIDWTEIDGLVASLRLSCGNAAIANADAAWNSSSLYR